MQSRLCTLTFDSHLHCNQAEVIKEGICTQTLLPPAPAVVLAPQRRVSRRNWSIDAEPILHLRPVFCQAQEPHRNLANKSDGKAITDTYHNTSSNPRLPAKSNLTKLDTECKADSAPGTSVN